MTDSRRVTCGEHGETPPAFACRHLVRGVACGFYASDGDGPPNAWCDLCDEAFQAEGEWNDVSEDVADIQLMCTGCYDAAHTRNAQPPQHARGVRARLTASEAAALIRHARHAVHAARNASRNRWSWHTMAGWSFDDEASTLTFSDPSRPSIVADVRLVGSYSTTTNTFQWAWETFGDDAREAVEIARLRGFGEVRGLEKLVTPGWKCDEADGWDMASLAGYLLGAEAVYRAPFDHQRWFMLLSNLRGSAGSTPAG